MKYSSLKAVMFHRILFSSLVWLSGISLGYSTIVSAEPNRLVQQKAQEIFKMHRRAKKALLGVIKEPEIRAYFTEKDPNKRELLRQKIEQTTLNFSEFFNISEMCLIDTQGHEVTRVDHGNISHELSTEEAELPFFAPGFAAEEGVVVTSPIYTSPDSHKVVAAYVSPIYVDAKPVAILHYEHELSDFQKKLLRGLEVGQVVIAVDSEDRVIIDSRRAELSGKDVKTLRGLGVTLFTSQMFDGLNVATVTDMIDNGDPIQGYTGAYKRVNLWTIYAFQASKNL